MPYRRLSLLVLASLAVLISVSRAGETAAGGEGLRLGLGLEFASAYVWRGIPYNEDAQLKPSLHLAYGDWALSVVGFIDTTDAVGREDNFAEVDSTLSYRHALHEHLTLTGGVIVYDYPGTGFKSDVEVFLALSALCPVRPTLTVYYDVRNIDGFFVNLGVSHEYALASLHEGLYLTLAADLGWASDNFGQRTLGVDGATMVAFSPGLTLTYRASERLSFSWYGRLDILLDDEVRDQIDASGRDADNFTFGASTLLRF